MRRTERDWALLPWGTNVSVTKGHGPVTDHGHSCGEYLLIQTDSLNQDELVPVAAAGGKALKTNQLPLLLNGASKGKYLDPSAIEPHLRFAEADTDEKLAGFLKDYGPVLSSWTDEKSEVTDRLGKKATVREELVPLRAERSRFASLLRLIGRLKQPTYIRGEVMEAADDVSRGYGTDGPESCPVYLMALWGQEGVSDRTMEALLYEDLLRFLRPFRFVPKVVFDGPKARPRLVVLPDREGRGFRYILYGLLFRELETNRLPVRVCMNEPCGRAFRTYRRDQRFCTSRCAAQAASRAYYARTGKRKRAEARSIRGPRRRKLS